MRSSKFTTIINQALVATGLVLGSTLASAPTVSVVDQNVAPGGVATVSVNIVAADLVNAAGGSMDVTWDSTVLTLNLGGGALDDGDVLIATPPWDDPDTSTFSDRGVGGDTVTSGLLSGLRVGTFNFVTGAAPVATLTFDVVAGMLANPGDSTTISVADGAGQGGGWSPPIDLYEAGTVNVVPIPAAVWLFGSGLLGLVGVARRRKG